MTKCKNCVVEKKKPKEKKIINPLFHPTSETTTFSQVVHK